MPETSVPGKGTRSRTHRDLLLSVDHVDFGDLRAGNPDCWDLNDFGPIGACMQATPTVGRWLMLQIRVHLAMNARNALA